MIVLLSALALLAQPKLPSDAPQAEIYLQKSANLPIESFANAVRPWGRIESRTPGTSFYLIDLKPGVNPEHAREALSHQSGIRPIEPLEDPIDMRSILSVSRKINDLSRDEKVERLAGRKVKAEREKEAADYLKAYRYFVGQRAFPNDKVDWGSYSRARTHLAQMKYTQFRGSSTKSSMTSPTWTYVGPINLAVPYTQYYGVSPVTGRFNAVAFDPNTPTVMYGGAAQGGLWKSIDGGVTWNWLSANWSHLGVNCIVIDPTNTNTIYVGLGDYHGYLGESVGVMKSTDGGTTWTEVGTASMGQIGVAKIIIDPTASQNLIAGTGDINSFGRLYRSTNGGQTWTPVTTLANSYWPAIAASTPVGNTVRFYAVAAGYGESNGTPGSRVYKSDDHGATWQLLASPITADKTVHWAYCVATSPTNPNSVYVFDSENEKLIASTNQGATWQDITANFPHGNQIASDYNFSQSFYDFHMECGSRTVNSVTTDVIYVGEIDIVETADNGATWQSIGGPSYTSSAITHNDQHALAVCPTNPNFALFSNDGGIYTVTYNPSINKNSVVSLNKTLGGSMFYYIAMHPTNPSIMIGGTQDNATPISTGDLSNWLNVGGGDGGGSAINQTNPLTQYTTSENFVFFRTGDGWANEYDISPSSGTDPTPFVVTVALSPKDQTQLYSGTNYLYLFDEKSLTWTSHVGKTRLTGAPTTSNSPLIQAIAIAPSDSTRIYTGSTDGQLWMSTNTGTTWKQLNPTTGALPLRTITSVNVNPANPSDILIGFSGTGTGHLWRCTNTTATSVTFANVSSAGVNALPDLPLNAIARDLDNPATTWWVATDLGVYRSIDSGTTWTNAGSALGLPNVIVDDLVAVPGTRYLNAGTYGRGIWRLALPAPSATLSTFALATNSTRRGNSVTGTVNLTSAAPTGGFTVTITSANIALASVPPSITIPAGATSATFQVTTLGTVTSPGSTTITVANGAVSLAQPLAITVPTISGNITFSDYLGTKPASVVLSFRSAGATSPFTTMTVSVDASGNYIAQNVPTQAYTVYVQPRTWLRKAIALDLTTNDVTANFVLVNGDIDGNNRINTTDRRLISVANGSKPTSANWNPKADLNGDGVVDSKDYAILYKNYGRIGDQ